MGAMADRFDKFTDNARSVLLLSQEEAIRLNHNYVGTEHFLLELTRIDNSTASRVLATFGVELDKARTATEFIAGRKDQAVSGEIGLNPGAQKTIEMAVDECHRMHTNNIRMGHLLLGLLREGQGIRA